MDTNSLKALLDSLQPGGLTKTAISDVQEKIGTELDLIQKVKTARKLDFDTTKCLERKIEETCIKTSAITYDTSYRPKYEDLQLQNVSELVQNHDSRWCVDWMKNVVTAITEELTTFRYVCGSCRKQVPSQAKIKNHMRNLFHLNEKVAFDDQILKLADDIMNWSRENQSRGEEIGDVELTLKEELLDMNYDQLMDTFDWSDEDIITYHVFHYTTVDTALPIIRAVRLLITEHTTPKNIGLAKEDDWEGKIMKYLGLEDEDDVEETEMNDLEDDWDEELEALDEKYNEIIKKEDANNINRKKHKKNSNASQQISIMTLSTKKVRSFTTKGECMKFLGCGYTTFSQFLKGKSKLNKRYQVVDIQ